MTKGNMIFVFGSNLGGRHGAGAALYARLHCGARYGVGAGLSGNSYAIPTKSASLKTLPLNVITLHIGKFKEFAKANPGLNFKVTQVGCGLAGYSAKDIAPLFRDSPSNCYFDYAWVEYLEGASFWNDYANHA